VEHEVRHVGRHGQPGGAPRVIWAAHLQLPPAPRRLLPPHRLPWRRLRRWDWSMPPASLQQPSSQVITCHQVMIHAGDLIRRCHACGVRKRWQLLTWRSGDWSAGAGPRPRGGGGWAGARGMGRGIICMGRVPIIWPGSSMPGGMGRPGMPGPGLGMPIPAARHKILSSCPRVH
jgi:hypothetical protein